MRRRGTGSFDFRRSLGKKKFWWMTVTRDYHSWLSLLLAGFLLLLILLLIIFFSSQQNTYNSNGTSTPFQKFYKQRRLVGGPNLTDEMLNPSSFTRQLVDQISLAKGLVVIAKESNNLQFAWELSSQIRNLQALLSRAAITRIPLSNDESETAIRAMALLLYQAQQFHYDSATTLMMLKSQVQILEENANLEKEKSTKYGQIAAEEVPKGLYCLGTRLTMEWYKNSNLIQNRLANGKWSKEKLKDNSLNHYCVFSDNVLAASAVVNSTAANSKNPDGIVFHIVTDEVNYAAMRAWFSMNNFKGVIIDVQNVGHFHDDDVIVQKDLADLFLINLNGNVMGTVVTCMETFHRFHKYLNYSHPLIRAHFDPDACGWAFGMNVINLNEWRKRNVTGIYHYWQEQNADHTLWKLGSLPPGLLAFHGLVEILDPRWHALGLGYSNVDSATICSGAVVHWNGNQKPWLKIANEKYKGIWDKYVDYSHPLLQRCNIH